MDDLLKKPAIITLSFEAQTNKQQLTMHFPDEKLTSFVALSHWRSTRSKLDPLPAFGVAVFGSENT
ncbi:MAG: hypothetical protein E6H48_15545 [Betaproteobacteria bacterium]|nr:MAG: hypothetical protein E6H48_15545 [Betaproteobacteria bacterium]